MRKSRFSDEQIAMALRQAEGGTSVDEIFGVSRRPESRRSQRYKAEFVFFARKSAMATRSRRARGRRPRVPRAGRAAR